MNTPLTSIIKNDGITQFFDVSYSDFQRNGDVGSLKQNHSNSCLDYLKKMLSFEEIPKEFKDVTQFYNAFKDVYDGHRSIMMSSGRYLKELGTLSFNQAKKCRKAVECMVSSILFSKDKKVDYKSQQYVAFVTLTLPSAQLHSDKQLRKLQTRYIENLQKTYRVKHYVWKAEAQKNGNIHFHLLIDRWIDWTVHRRLWNSQLDKLGYLDKFCENYGHRNPNSVDVHSLKKDKRGRKIVNPSKYITKYMTKVEFGKRPIVGKVWGCSNETKKLDYPRYAEGDPFFYQVLNIPKKHFFKTVLQEDFYSHHVGKSFEVIKNYYKQLWNDLKQWFQLINGVIKPRTSVQKEFVRLKHYKKPVPTSIGKIEILQKPTLEVVQNSLFYVNPFNSIVPVKHS